jgi:hypothetical protein
MAKSTGPRGQEEADMGALCVPKWLVLVLVLLASVGTASAECACPKTALTVLV